MDLIYINVTSVFTKAVSVLLNSFVTAYLPC